MQSLLPKRCLKCSTFSPLPCFGVVWLNSEDCYTNFDAWKICDCWLPGFTESRLGKLAVHQIHHRSDIIALIDDDRLAGCCNRQG